MRILRWAGYLLLLLIALVIVALLFIDPIAKWAIETEGSKAVKAKVEVGEVDIRFSPPGATLSDIAVTNPQSPMTNAFQARKVDASLAFAPLLQSKIIIEDATASGMLFNQARSESGAIPGLTPPAPEGPSMVERIRQDFKLPTIDLPDPESLLARLDLETVKLASSLRNNAQATEAQWKARIASLPDEKKVEGWKQKVEALKKEKNPLKRIQAAAELVRVQKEIKADLEQVKALKKDFDRDLQSLRDSLQQVRAAPAQDMQRALKLVGLDPEAMDGLARALLGDEVGNWLQNAFAWYKTLQPYMNGASGGEPKAAVADTRDYSDGLPKFLIKQLHIDGALPVPGEAVQFKGEMRNLTDQAQIWGKPADLMLSGGNATLGSLNLKGLLDHVNPADVVDRLDLDLSAFPIKNFRISDDADFPIVLAHALTKVAGAATIRNGALDLKLDADFFKVQLADLVEDSGSPVKQALIGALRSLERFDLIVQATGALEDPDVRFKSSLDRILGAAVKNVVAGKRKELESKLKSRINALTKEHLAGLDQQLSGMTGLDTKLQSKIGNLGSLL